MTMKKFFISSYFTTYKQITIKKVQGLQHVTNNYEKVIYFILIYNITVSDMHANTVSQSTKDLL